MRYYILRTYGKTDTYCPKENPNYTFKESDSYSPDKNLDYTFKRTNINAEKFLNDCKTEDIYYFLYHIPSKKFVEYGEIEGIKSDPSTGQYHAIYANRHNINIRYVPYSSPNCGIIPISKKRIEEILNNN